MIRVAGNSDIPEIGKLLYTVNKIHSDGRPDIFISGSRKYSDKELAGLLRDPMRPVFVYINDEGTVCGHAFCVIEETKNCGCLHDSKVLYIDDICVGTEHRRMGVGAALYRHVIEYAREINCSRVTLNVWEFNTGARAFYEALGMKPLKTMMERIL